MSEEVEGEEAVQGDQADQADQADQEKAYKEGTRWGSSAEVLVIFSL